MLKTILRILLLTGLAAYLVVSAAFTTRLADTRVCQGMEVVLDDDQNLGFVRTAELTRELGHLYTGAPGHLLCTFPLDSVERKLLANDKIETVQAMILTNDSVRVVVKPMVPVARVFDNDGTSYYINRTGKRISADARYHLDVPVIKGNFHRQGYAPAKLLPLVDYIENHQEWRILISMIEAPDSNNVYLIPDIRNQVIKFGSADGFDDKFSRLDRFYRHVLPYKGWNYYDTISVKWAGQVVASRSDKRHASNALPVDTLPQSAYDEAVPILNVPTTTN